MSSGTDARGAVLGGRESMGDGRMGERMIADERAGGATRTGMPPTLAPAIVPASAHRIVRGDARDLSFLPARSVHLVVTSPPYFDLKQYASDSSCQLGDIHDYERFLGELDKVWRECERVLVPGGRVCCVVGAITIARRVGGRHHVLPLPADIQVRSRRFGLDNLTPIIWLKVSNITLEASNSSRFLGKPNLPNGIIKNDFETIVMLRKPGGYRQPTPAMEAASRIEDADYVRWFAPIWSDITGASTREHPAPYPVELVYRLIRMFSFTGDTVLDPFLGSGTTIQAAIRAGRNSVGVEPEPQYVALAQRRLARLPFGVTLAVEDATAQRVALRSGEQ